MHFIWEDSSEDDEDSLWYTATTFFILFILNLIYSAAIMIVKVSEYHIFPSACTDKEMIVHNKCFIIAAKYIYKHIFIKNPWTN